MKNYKLLFLTTISLWLGAGQLTALATHDDLDKPLRKADDMKGDSPRVQDFDEIVSPDMESAWSLAERSRHSLKNGNVSRALALATKAMKMDDDDIEIHLVYAQAMQEKYERQTEKDPELLKKCVHEWVLVYRNEVGMEKGMTFKGLNLAGTYWNDDDHGTVAKKQLIKLTGYAPKLWETDNHYLTRVTKPAETAVSAKIKSTSDDGEKSAAHAQALKPAADAVLTKRKGTHGQKQLVHRFQNNVQTSCRGDAMRLPGDARHRPPRVHNFENAVLDLTYPGFVSYF